MNNNYNNFYNPYLYTRQVPNMMNYTRAVPNAFYQAAPTRAAGGLLSRIFPGLAGTGASTGLAGGVATKGITFSGILNGASKTLGVINQAIPVINQAKPIWNNAKTMFKMAKVMNSNDYEITKKTPTNNSTDATSATDTVTKKVSSNEPTFFR